MHGTGHAHPAPIRLPSHHSSWRPRAAASYCPLHASSAERFLPVAFRANVSALWLGRDEPHQNASGAISHAPGHMLVSVQELLQQQSRHFQVVCYEVLSA